MSICTIRYHHSVRYFLFVLLLPCWFSANAQDSTLVVIGNQAGVPAEINMTELKAVFRGERQRWKDGTKVVIAMIKSTSPLGKIVSEKVYSKSGEEVRGFWAAISFAGKFDPPNVFNTDAEVEAFVAQNPGAIAILNRSITTSDVKTVLVSGKKTF
jgi:hypothetical protein